MHRVYKFWLGLEPPSKLVPTAAAEQLQQQQQQQQQHKSNWCSSLRFVNKHKNNKR